MTAPVSEQAGEGTGGASFAGGGLANYNRQFANAWVAGLEADWTGMKTFRLFFVCPPEPLSAPAIKKSCSCALMAAVSQRGLRPRPPRSRRGSRGGGI
jgi:hypothetical protein